MPYVRCMCCGQQFDLKIWTWYICDSCGYRICPACIGKHRGPYGCGTKCSQCQPGWLKKNK